jgi:glycerophosphoryl diester phosphodiesterase
MIFNRSVLFLLTLLLFYSCRKATICRDIEVYGHAAMGLSMPNSGYHANSLEAISLASEFPTLKGIELDVRMSKDGELWLFHDDFLEDETTGAGCVEENMSVELETIHYKSFHKEKLTKLSSITFDSSKTYFLDLKCYNACTEVLVNLETFKQKLDHLAKPNLILILPSKDLFPYFSLDHNCVLSSDNIELIRQEFNTNDWYGVAIRNSKISAQVVQEFVSIGKRVYLYDIRSPKGTLKAIKKKPTGIITDDVFAAQSICK